MTSRKHFSWKCKNEWTKSRFEVVVTSNGRNKNRDAEKKQEEANNSTRYRCAAIKKTGQTKKPDIFFEDMFKIKKRLPRTHATN